MSENIAIKVENLTKTYRLYNSNLDRVKESLHPLRRIYHNEFYALNDVSFEIKKGETVGIIGKNGSGKSTLLKLITGVLTPSSGSVEVNGRISALLELGAGFNPELTGVENVYFNGTLMGYSKEEMNAKLDDILDFSDIGVFVHQPVKTYSSGMFVRLAFSVATILEPDILIVDEALSVGDLFFQQKCYARLNELKEKGVTILFVTHAMGDVVQYCQQSLLLNNNRLEYKGGSAEAVKRYLLVQQQERLAAFVANVPKENPQILNQQDGNNDFFWPDKTQFSDLSAIDVVTSGMAKCTGVVICNEKGVSSKLFTHGVTATIFCEFEINSAIEVPVAGFIIKNDQNIMVHGKNSLQYDGLSLPTYVQNDQKVRFRFDVNLNIAPGDYTIDVGLATLHKKDYDDRFITPPTHVQAKTLRLCNLSGAASFTVLQQPIIDYGYGSLHSGVCNLKGACTMSILSLTKKVSKPEGFEAQMPTIFHVTHWKAGSQWIKRILREAFPERYVDSKVAVAHFLQDPIQAGGIYPTVYVTKEQFESVRLPKNWHRFVIIRDLRDTLVSAYFSMKISHPILTPYNQQLRDNLISKSQEDGLIYLAEDWLAASAAIQKSWVLSNEEIIRYEDLLLNDVNILVDVLLKKCQLPIDEDLLRKIILSSRFESLTGGRKTGVEDVTAHERKGISGDWKNYFTKKVSDRFKTLYGELLIETGYEKDLNW